ncbi:MAG TPA: helical backbone metal receptor [Methylibium sp.]|uniref:ABC transporter substrate-binding protein n=1 Tax=Methylibium sp. TaxID=2067992 RepID=UPI002DBD66D0|nr:helical backbone metal receptor [Methylibium sp.]HEU4459890.1 helical backbone metal receptor [Methylibium sp.]
MTRFLPGLLLGALLALPVFAQVAVRDDRGAVRTLAAPPQRIVSLLPSITETVCALDACGRLVGVDRYSNQPAAVLALPRLGGQDDTSIERVVVLKPDVVLLAKSSRVIDRLEALGLNVLVFESQTHADVRASLERIAALLGVPERGPQVWAGIEARIDAAAQRVPVALRGAKVYFEVATAPYAAGEASFIGETLIRLGLGNVVPAALGPFPKLNPEFVVRAQPDVVIAEERAVRGMAARPGWASLRALRASRACALPSARYELLIRPGPRLGEAADLLVDCLAALPAQELAR